MNRIKMCALAVMGCITTNGYAETKVTPEQISQVKSATRVMSIGFLAGSLVSLFQSISSSQLYDLLAELREMEAAGDKQAIKSKSMRCRIRCAKRRAMVFGAIASSNIPFFVANSVMLLPFSLAFAGSHAIAAGTSFWITRHYYRAHKTLSSYEKYGRAKVALKLDKKQVQEDALRVSGIAMYSVATSLMMALAMLGQIDLMFNL
jgi:hypothetical protein